MQEVEESQLEIREAERNVSRGKERESRVTGTA